MRTSWQSLGPPPREGPHVGHAHFWERALSRGAVLKTAALAGGAAIGADLWVPGLARAAAPSNATPKPIPGGIQPLGPGTPLFHVMGGENPDGSPTEPSSITDFNGTVALAFTQGTGTGTDTTTGVATPLLFDSDMRIMVGEYIAVDGHHYHGVFGFVWLDVYKDQVDPFAPNTHQLHDFDLGIAPYPSGLFWTIPFNPNGIQLNRSAGMASYQATNLPVMDFGTLANAFNNLPSVPATASFHVQWQMLSVTGKKKMKVRNAAQGFAGAFWQSTATGAATLEWSATESGFTFASDPAATSTSYYAIFGHERNGAFFPQGDDGGDDE